MAGIYDDVRDAKGENKTRFLILTTSPNNTIEDVHNRMPVVLRPEEKELWLARPEHDEQLFDRQRVPLVREAV